jgi:hypothetical protein
MFATNSKMPKENVWICESEETENKEEEIKNKKRIDINFGQDKCLITYA